MTNNLKAERTLTAEEQRSIVDGEWWKSICEPCGLIVRGFTYRDSALVTDKDTGRALTIPGWFALRLQSLSTQQPIGEPVAWMHPTAGWARTKYHSVLVHCRKDGPKPIPLYALHPNQEGGE